MRSIIYVFIVLSIGVGLFGLGGCAAIVPESIKKTYGYGMEINFTSTIDVSSEPAGATIYFNNMAIGTTPVQNLPISITCIDDTDFIYQSFGAHQYSVRGQYYLRVSKDGYTDKIVPLEFNYDRTKGVGRPMLRETNFNFVLQKVDTATRDIPKKTQEVSSAPESKPTINEKKDEKLRLEAIYYDDKNPAAMINGRLVKIGDKIEDNLLIDIKKDMVVLYDGEKNFELRLEDALRDVLLYDI